MSYRQQVVWTLQGDTKHGDETTTAQTVGQICKDHTRQKMLKLSTAGATSGAKPKPVFQSFSCSIATRTNGGVNEAGIVSSASSPLPTTQQRRPTRMAHHGRHDLPEVDAKLSTQKVFVTTRSLSRPGGRAQEIPEIVPPAGQGCARNGGSIRWPVVSEAICSQ